MERYRFESYSDFGSIAQWQSITRRFCAFPLFSKRNINKMKKITRSFVGKEILCKSCKTKKYQCFAGYPKEEYGCMPIHKKNCKWFKKLLKNSVEI